MATLGQDFADYIARGGTTLATYLQPQSAVYQQLIAMSQQFNLGLEVIVTGIDRDGAFIARVTHPGTLARLDKLGYDAVGSGGIHALTKLQLGAQTFHRGLSQTLFAVYEAKKAAEVAPGVGDNTDMAVIDAKELYTCNEAVIQALSESLLEINKTSTPNLSKVIDAYAKSSPKS
jgi:20S proteasome alpha/beta subunit